MQCDNILVWGTGRKGKRVVKYAVWWKFHDDIVLKEGEDD